MNFFTMPIVSTSHMRDKDVQELDSLTTAYAGHILEYPKGFFLNIGEEAWWLDESSRLSAPLRCLFAHYQSQGYEWLRLDDDALR